MRLKRTRRSGRIHEREPRRWGIGAKRPILRGMRDVGRHDYGWAVFALVMLILLVGSVVDALWRVIVDGDWWSLAFVPLAIAFYWWWGMGAWRRTVWSRLPTCAFTLLATPGRGGDQDGVTRRGGAPMSYDFRVDDPITEEQALAEAAELGLHAFAFDLDIAEDEELHWHEFSSVSWLISGTGSLEVDGDLLQLVPGCRLEAPAGLLHRNLGGPPYRVVLATDIPGEQWTMPINKDPADRPAELAG